MVRKLLYFCALTLIWTSSSCRSATPPISASPTVVHETETPGTALTYQGKWIEVDLSEQLVLLREDEHILDQFLMSSGIGDSPETTTYPGNYSVRLMYPGPEETVPGVYVRDVIMFDLEHMNGFHSQPMDAEGRILDETLGEPASAGCIRMADSKALYDFAMIGMPVIVHE